MGLDPRIFGPSFWGALHLACFNPDNPGKVQDFINLYQYVLPCPACRHHFAQVLKEFPVPDDPENMFDWSVMAHNVVNEKLGKPTFTKDEALIFWIGNKLMEFEMAARPPPEFPYVPVVAGLIALILIIIFLKYNK